MTGEHVSAQVLAAYAEEQLTDGDAESVEAHLDSCDACRASLPPSEAVQRVVASVALALDGLLSTPGRLRPGTGWRRVRVLVGAAPAVRAAWLLSVLVTGLLILGLAVSPRSLPPWVLLLIAPALPVVGTALSYGPRTDPLHEVVAGTPQGGLRIVLWRTLAVLTVATPVAVLAAVVTGISTPLMWALPGAALTAGTLALGSLIEPTYAAAVVAGVWAVVVLAPPVGGLAVVAASAPVWLAVTGVAVVVLYARRDRVGRQAG